MSMRKPRFAAVSGALWAMALSLLLAACAQNLPKETKTAQVDDIRAVLDSQARAWNRGDIEDFMQGYWHDARLRFASGDHVVYGWQPTLDRYRQRYPDRATMGSLAFADLDIDVLAPDAALVFGHWSLVRAGDAPGNDPHGVFTLEMRRLEDGWKIVADHTSAAGG